MKIYYFFLFYCLHKSEYLFCFVFFFLSVLVTFTLLKACLIDFILFHYSFKSTMNDLRMQTRWRMTLEVAIIELLYLLLMLQFWMFSLFLFTISWLVPRVLMYMWIIGGLCKLTDHRAAMLHYFLHTFFLTNYKVL